MTVPPPAQPRSQKRRWMQRGSPQALVEAFAAFGVQAEIRGGAVHAWIPGREDITVVVVPGWQPDHYRTWLKRRVWSWQRGTSQGSRLRADTSGVAIGVTTLLRLGGRY